MQRWENFSRDVVLEFEFQIRESKSFWIEPTCTKIFVLSDSDFRVRTRNAFRVGARACPAGPAQGRPARAARRKSWWQPSVGALSSVVTWFRALLVAGAPSLRLSNCIQVARLGGRVADQLWHFLNGTQARNHWHRVTTALAAWSAAHSRVLGRKRPGAGRPELAPGPRASEF